ncbi:hypothetical protein E4U43_001955 [Claviceps pusilla]|uniref:Uncharacterized protein n=1 Tax=Claviceps pusilla TaxID=123648 RepID=A0A9P7T0S3_9HYPO|nr:hypothetical protein E4U43_001955 [Claviceps pusilla]
MLRDDVADLFNFIKSSLSRADAKPKSGKLQDGRIQIFRLGSGRSYEANEPVRTPWRYLVDRAEPKQEVH